MSKCKECKYYIEHKNVQVEDIPKCKKEVRMDIPRTHCAWFKPKSILDMSKYDKFITEKFGIPMLKHDLKSIGFKDVDVFIEKLKIDGKLDEFMEGFFSAMDSEDEAEYTKDDMLKFARDCVKLSLTVASVPYDEEGIKTATEKLFETYYGSEV